MKLFEKTLNILQSGVMILDDELNIVFINLWLQKAFAYVDAQPGENLLSLCPELKGRRIEASLRQALDSGLPAVLSPVLNRSPLPLYHNGQSQAEPFAQMIRVQPMREEEQNYCMLEVQDVSSVIRRERLLNEQADKLNQMALTDELTGIANRRHFNSLLEKAVASTIDSSQSLSLIFFDIDYFKPYNDHLGHQAGDHCLARITQHLNDILKGEGYHLARYGGEEFCIILPGVSPAQATVLAENYRQNVERLAIRHPASSVAKVVTASFGVSGFNAGKSDTFTGLVLKADNALYRAKMSGRNQVIQACLDE
ncbi:GGDEF domain-containing protein [Oceanospirillum beijerinckii]|uniref:GGDEF domain-containing protein n=1 Tax=Oceanospirillum beijerinckii TaxID=64976 RepID=UPI0004052059|nr:GGDEF domain-containing protein [Oceanospirillum beijerinckii]